MEEALEERAELRPPPADAVHRPLFRGTRAPPGRVEPYFPAPGPWVPNARETGTAPSPGGKGPSGHPAGSHRELASGGGRVVLFQAMAFFRLSSMAARKSWVLSHGWSLEMSSARSLVI